MAKKRTSLSQTLFGEIDPYGAAPEETAPINSISATLPLAAIRPDPHQPRQLLPPALGQALTAGQMTSTEALRTWLSQADEAQAETAPRSLREIRRLADSIAQHGLINPITVRSARPDETLPPGVAYIIVTGERRYWAHILLANEGRTIQEGSEICAPDQIKALVAQAGVTIRAHQLIENLMREDINAIEKAHGLWALRYELSGVNHGSPPSEMNPAIAAAPDSTATLVPWGQVEQTLDISKRYRIFITNTLDLSTEAQRLVAENDLSERVIRPIVQKLKGRPDLQVEALQQLLHWREAENIPGEAHPPLTDSTEALVTELLNRVEARDSATTSARKPVPLVRRSLGTEQFRQKVQNALRFLNKLDEPDLVDLTHDLATTTQYAEVVTELRDLRERIDTILEAVDIHSRQK